MQKCMSQRMLSFNVPILRSSLKCWRILITLYVVLTRAKADLKVHFVMFQPDESSSTILSLKKKIPLRVFPEILTQSYYALWKWHCLETCRVSLCVFLDCSVANKNKSGTSGLEGERWQMMSRSFPCTLPAPCHCHRATCFTLLHHS